MRPDGSADPAELGVAVDRLVDHVLGLTSLRPRAVGLTCAWHALVGLGGTGESVTQLTTWVHSGAGPDAAWLREAVGSPTAVHQRTGAPLHPSFPSSRLKMLMQKEPDACAQVELWSSLGEFLLRRWFGLEVPASFSMASGSGLYNQAALGWDEELLDLLVLDERRLGPVADAPQPGTDLRLLEPYRRRWTRLIGVPWTPAFGDGGAVVVGSNCEGSGRIALTVGTSAAGRILVSRLDRLAQPLSPGLFAYLLDRERSVVGVARSNAGNLLAWARRNLLLPSEDDLVLAATAGRKPGGHGLNVDPSLAGERSPAWPLEARGVLGGLSSSTGPLDILQALLEASVLGLCRSLEELEAWAGPGQFVLSGGAARVRGWRELLAAATGRRLLAGHPEASLRGAASLAWRMIDPEWEGPPAQEEDTITPDPQKARAYEQMDA
ncbi:MAG: gluconokinase [Thermoleophilia bacterium]